MHQFIIYKINHWLKYILYQSNYIISTLATALIQSETTSCDQEIFTAIYDLKKKRKLADIYIYIYIYIYILYTKKLLKPLTLKILPRMTFKIG